MSKTCPLLIGLMLLAGGCPIAENGGLDGEWRVTSIDLGGAGCIRIDDSRVTEWVACNGSYTAAVSSSQPLVVSGDVYTWSMQLDGITTQLIVSPVGDGTFQGLMRLPETAESSIVIMSRN